MIETGEILQGETEGEGAVAGAGDGIEEDQDHRRHDEDRDPEDIGLAHAKKGFHTSTTSLCITWISSGPKLRPTRSPVSWAEVVSTLYSRPWVAKVMS